MNNWKIRKTNEPFWKTEICWHPKKSMKNHGNPYQWISWLTSWNLQKTQDIQGCLGNSWKSKEFHGNLGNQLNPWRPTEVNAYSSVSIDILRNRWRPVRIHTNLWKSMEGSSWQSMDINGNCHNSSEVHGCPRKRVDISYNKCGVERWGQTNVVVFNEPDTIASQPAPPHRPRAYRGRPRCAWSWFWRSWAIPEINDYHG